jgi:hypothetical protein
MNNINSTIVLASGLVGFCVWLYIVFVKKPVPAPYPPGPKGLPLLGNITDIPQTQPWVTFSKWGETYGTSIPAVPPMAIKFLRSPYRPHELQEALYTSERWDNPLSS